MKIWEGLRIPLEMWWLKFQWFILHNLNHKKVKKVSLKFLNRLNPSFTFVYLFDFIQKIFLFTFLSKQEELKIWHVGFTTTVTFKHYWVTMMKISLFYDLFFRQRIDGVRCESDLCNPIFTVSWSYIYSSFIFSVNSCKIPCFKFYNVSLLQ